MAEVVDLEIDQGATFDLPLMLNDPVLDVDGNVVLDVDGNPEIGDPTDLTGCTVRMQIRPRVKSPTAWVTASSKSIEDDPVGGERITFGDPGEINIRLTDQDTMKVVKTTAVYDIELVRPLVIGELRPEVERLQQGAITCNLNVTRIPEDDA